MSAGLHQIKALQAARIEKEMKALKAKKRDYIEGHEKQPGDKDVWNFKIRSKTAPFAGRPLVLAIDYSGEYPFRPPTVRFTHTVYHPNVDKTGEVCIPILSYDNWKPTTTFEAILLAILQLLAEPDLARPVRFDIADEYIHNYKRYLKNAARAV